MFLIFIPFLFFKKKNTLIHSWLTILIIKFLQLKVKCDFSMLEINQT